MFAITPIVLVLLAVAGGGVAKIGNSQDQDNTSVEATEIVQFDTCVAAQTEAAELQTQDPVLQVQAECDSAYEPELQAALDQ